MYLIKNIPSVYNNPLSAATKQYKMLHTILSYLNIKIPQSRTKSNTHFLCLYFHQISVQLSILNLSMDD